MERKQFTFYESFARSISHVKSKAARCDIYDAICNYALYGREPDVDRLPDAAAMAFRELKPLLDYERRSAEDIRRSTEYKEWRNAVYKRDDYTCQVCGKKGVKLNAHHIKPFAYYHDLRTDLGNGITLCVECHKAVHHGA